MRIIDAHIHLHSDPYFSRIAEAAGHENSLKHLQEVYWENHIVGSVIMGNRGLAEQMMEYPEAFSYCAGIDSSIEIIGSETFRLLEEHLKRPACVGIKLYPGYTAYSVSDPIYHPVYKLAQRYQKPVAVHTGATSSSNARLRFSHPLTLDDAAAQWPEVQFIMCHFGNPWFVDAAAVMEKNPNVTADLSGMLVGLLNMREFLVEQSGYIEQLRTWIAYVGDYERFLFGTDWPLANMENYIAFVKDIIPRRYWEMVFFHNANRIYKLGLK